VRGTRITSWKARASSHPDTTHDILMARALIYAYLARQVSLGSN